MSLIYGYVCNCRLLLFILLIACCILLVDSSGVLRQSNTEMKNMGSHIDISTRLITKFGRRQVVDKLLILFGLVLFFSVVLYILKKRLFG